MKAEIKAEELMRNNWLNHKGEPCRVFSISKEWLRIDKISENYIDIAVSYDHLSGIPLTPEILEKCGFEKWDWHDGCIIPFMGKHLMIRLYNGRILTTTLKVEKDKRGHLGKDSTEFLKPDQLKFLHQLQNLHFAITGTHLTIEP